MCLNPGQRHSSLVRVSSTNLCPEPSCGFLLEGVQIRQWRITSLLKHSRSMDLYAAIFANDQRTQRATDIVVRVLRSTNQALFSILKPLQMLYHPYIHSVLALDEVQPGGPLYILSQFEERGSLASILEAKTPLSFLSIAGIVKQIAEALSAAHRRNLVHGHLKPENCLLSAPGVVQVCDFHSALLGKIPVDVPTPFIAPEQFQGVTLPASDQFALARLTDLLFRRCSPLASGKLQDKVRGDMEYLQHTPTGPLFALPRLLEQELRRAQSQDPDRRFPDLQTFIRTLEAALGQLMAGSSSTLKSAWDTLLPGVQNSSALTMTPFSPLEPTSHADFPAISLSQTPTGNRGTTTPIGRNPQSDALRLTTPYQRRFPAQNYQNKQQNIVQKQAPGGITSISLLPGHISPISALCWERTGRALASGSNDGEIRLWAFQGTIGRPDRLLQGHKGNVQALCWSPDSTCIASASSDAALRIWDVSVPSGETCQVETSWWGHNGEILALGWAPNSAILASGGKDGTLRFWNRKGEALAKQPAHGSKGVKSLAWSPDQSLIATGGGDYLIQIWDGATYQLKQAWRAHLDEVRWLQWSPNGQFLLSAAGKKDTHIHLWDTQTGLCLATISEHLREIVGLFWSNDSSWLASCSADGTLRFWKTDHLLEKNLLLPQGSPVTLNEVPQIMQGLPDNRMLAIATRSLSVEIFEMR
ncbi:MAG TPA: WD40 repeat domain-containing serine/threonine-protein kinase [Ktedonobacteraceae bacterium]|nr:WD40 repeat domain-containing serine/threonine-protein kinase [Ktedonobacteraceae bacterium]